jgi:hypothetical protein
MNQEIVYHFSIVLIFLLQKRLRLFVMLMKIILNADIDVDRLVPDR